MDWTDLGNAALGLMASVLVALTVAARALVPVAIEVLRERLLASRNARVVAAAETVAAEIARSLVPDLAAGVTVLRDRLPSTMAALGHPPPDVLRGIIIKAGAAATGGSARP